MTRATSGLRALTRLRGEGNRLLWLHLSTSGGKKETTYGKNSNRGLQFL